MKKILSAVLAAAMLLTVAFAAEYQPGQTVTFDGSEAAWDTAPAKPLTSENYYVYSTNWTKGNTLVSSVKFDADGGLEISLKQDYKASEDKPLEGTVVIREKGGKVSHTLTVATTVGYIASDITIDADGSIPALTVNDGTVYTVTKAGSIPYGTLQFTAAGGIDVSVRVYEGEKFFLENNDNVNTAILIANADLDADISFLNFTAAPTFTSKANITLYGMDKDTFIYTLNDGKLTKASAVWNEESGIWTLSSKTLGSYVISDKALKSADGTNAGSSSSGGSSSTAPNNPSTGAGSAVGIATAIALTGIISVAAVSLKK